MPRIHTAVLSLAALALALPALPAPAPAEATAESVHCAGVVLPASIAGDEAPVLHLNGVGARRVGWMGIGFDVYVAALYLDARRDDAGTVLRELPPLRLALHFVRDTDRARLVEGFDEALAAAIEDDPGLAPELAPKTARLGTWMRDLDAGSVLAFTHRPGRGLAVEVDRERLGTIEGDAFARMLLAHWLEGDGVQASLARALIEGGPCDG